MRLLLFLIFFFPFLGFSQHSYKAEKIIFPENVVSDVVFGTFKKDGFLYVATQKGLYLYDGYIFVNSKSVTHGIHYFYTDGNTVYLEESGIGLVSVRDIYSEKKILKNVVYTDSIPDNDYYKNIYKDDYGNIWTSDFHNIKYLSPQNRIQTFVISTDKKHQSFDINYFPVKDGLLITSDFGIFIWNKNNPQKIKQINSEKITSSVRYNGKFFVVKNNNSIQEFSLPDKKLNELSFDKTENIRFIQNISDGTPQIIFDQNSVYELDFQHHSKRLIYTSEEKINHIFYDQKTGFFWISTQNGLVKLIREKEIVKNIELPFVETVTSILETENGVFWFADNRGNIIRKKGNQLKKFFINEKTHQLSFSDGKLLVGTENGVYSANPKDENPSFKKIISTPEKIKKALIHKGKIWALPESGKIKIYDAKTLKEIPDFIKNNFKGCYETAVYNDIIENNGTIWIASWLPQDYGITYFDEKSRLLKQISNPNTHNPEFVGDYYNRVNKLKNGSLIFSAYGWNTVSEKGKILKSIFINDFGNVADNNIQGITEDSLGNIWFGCAEGLYRYNEKMGSIIRISKKDGLASNNLIFGFLLGSDNQLYFSSEKNVQKIDLNLLQKLKFFDEFKITGIKITDNFISEIPDEIKVSEANAQQIDIYFSVLNFWGKDKIKYRYHFGDEKWKNLGDDPRLSLVKLGHGNYDITIEAYDDLEGNHNKQIALKLNIIPPFYKTIWFISLVSFCVSLLLFFISKYFIHKEKQHGLLLEKIKENENKMLRSQMNPHFLFNSLNSINSFIILNKPKEASGYLTSFSKLMRKILDNSRKDNVTLKEELEAAKLYLDLEAVRLEHKFDYGIIIDKKINEDDILIPALILQPFLENSVWHGLHPKKENGYIDIKINKGDDDKNPFLNITIEDNGIGRKAALNKKKETLHKSHGLNITLERLRMSDTKNKVEIIDLYDKNMESCGTKVELKIYYTND